MVHVRRGALDDAKRADDRQRHALVADAKIAARALGLRAPIAVNRHLDRAEAVALDAGLRHEGRQTTDGGTSLVGPSVVCPLFLAEPIEPHDLAAAGRLVRSLVRCRLVGRFGIGRCGRRYGSEGGCGASGLVLGGRPRVLAGGGAVVLLAVGLLSFFLSFTRAVSDLLEAQAELDRWVEEGF